MRKPVAALVVAAALCGPAASATTRPLGGSTLIAIDKRAGFRNFLPTRMLAGFTYRSWSSRGGVLRVEFRSKAGLSLEWDVSTMPAAQPCGTGSQQSFQLAGNKVWWAQRGELQLAWRCVFGQDGVPLLLAAASPVPPSKLAAVGLGMVAASAKRY